MSINIKAIDHIVLTVADIDRSCEFYSSVLGMEVSRFGASNAGGMDQDTVVQRTALSFGQQKINLHEYGNEFNPHAGQPLPGSADLCFITQTPLSDVMAHLQKLGVPVQIGPVARTGALGPLESVYIRDPDENLLEISNYINIPA